MNFVLKNITVLFTAIGFVAFVASLASLAIDVLVHSLYALVDSRPRVLF